MIIYGLYRKILVAKLHKLFVFAIGGTGSRVLKSMIMMCAAGVRPVDANGVPLKDVEIVPIDIAGNQPLKQVSVDEARKWNHTVSDDEIHALLTYLNERVSAGGIDAGSLPSATGNLLSIAGARQDNIALAKQINEKVRELTQEYKIR